MTPKRLLFIVLLVPFFVLACEGAGIKVPVEADMVEPDDLLGSDRLGGDAAPDLYEPDRFGDGASGEDGSGALPAT